MGRHLFVPGLLGPMPGLGHEPVPSFPRLERLLACADRQAEPEGFAAALFALFGIEIPAGTDVPTAPVSYLADTGNAPSGFVLHADPLQLLADRDRLLAFDLDDDPLDAAEIGRLAEAFNEHYREEGLELFGSPAGRVFLHCARVPSIRTHPLGSVIGRNVDGFLPDGDDRRQWRGLLNETQMLCHALDFNQEREERGRPVLGGLWFSGGGLLPAPGQRATGRLIGDCVLSRGLLALNLGAAVDELVVEHAAGRAVLRADPAAWLKAIGELEGRLAGLMEQPGDLYVHPGNGRFYRWTARSARRFWRRKRPLHALVTPDT